MVTTAFPEVRHRLFYHFFHVLKFWCKNKAFVCKYRMFEQYHIFFSKIFLYLHFGKNVKNHIIRTRNADEYQIFGAFSVPRVFVAGKEQ